MVNGPACIKNSQLEILFGKHVLSTYVTLTNCSLGGLYQEIMKVLHFIFKVLRQSAHLKYANQTWKNMFRVYSKLPCNPQNYSESKETSIMTFGCPSFHIFGPTTFPAQYW